MLVAATYFADYSYTLLESEMGGSRLPPTIRVDANDPCP